MQLDDRIQRLENKIKLLEQGKARDALAALRRHLNRRPSLFDPFEAIELLETLVRLARTQAHGKADEYAAALEEVKTRQPTLDSTHLQRLMLGANMATSILKGMSKTSPSGSQARRPLHRSTPYSVQCYACLGGGTLHVIVSPDTVVTLHVDVGANNCIWIFCYSRNCAFCLKYISFIYWTCLFCFVLGWDLCPCAVDLGGTFSVSQFRT